VSPQEITRNVIDLVTTAGVKKDVTDLLKEKVALHTEKIAALEAANTKLNSKIADLEQELDRLRPKEGRFEKDAERFLELLFDQSDDEGIAVEFIGQALGISKPLAEYHRNNLMDAKILNWARFNGLILSPEGIAYCVKIFGKK
jgi:hypothetical protein